MVETRFVREPYIRINGILKVTYSSLAGFQQTFSKEVENPFKRFHSEYGIWFVFQRLPWQYQPLCDLGVGPLIRTDCAVLQCQRNLLFCVRLNAGPV